jgi:hypothetical protein
MSRATQGAATRLEAYQVWPDSPQLERDFLYVALSLAARAELPWAGDVERIAERNALRPVSVDGFQQEQGKGCGGLVKLPNEQRPRPVLFGDRDYVAAGGLEIPEMLERVSHEWSADPAHELVWGGWDGQVRGLLKLGRPA